jgi:hypothetical protein
MQYPRVFISLNAVLIFLGLCYQYATLYAVYSPNIQSDDKTMEASLPNKMTTAPQNLCIMQTYCFVFEQMLIYVADWSLVAVTVQTSVF